MDDIRDIRKTVEFSLQSMLREDTKREWTGEELMDGLLMATVERLNLYTICKDAMNEAIENGLLEELDSPLWSGGESMGKLVH